MTRDEMIDKIEADSISSKEVFLELQVLIGDLDKYIVGLKTRIVDLEYEVAEIKNHKQRSDSAWSLTDD